MKKIINCIIVETLCVMSVFSQDMQFSQFYAAPLYLGPSMAGVNGDPRLIANYRDQWPKLSGRFTTQAISFDAFLEQYQSGLGLMLLNDKVGGNKMVTTLASIDYSYRLMVNRDFFLQPGLAFQYFKRTINYRSLELADQFFENMVLPSTIEKFPEDSKGHADFSSSLLAFGAKFWIGATLDHMMKLSSSLKENDAYLPLKFSLYGGYKFNLWQTSLNRIKKSIYLAYLFQNQNALNQLDIGIYYKQLPIMVGLWYRGVPLVKSLKSSDAIILLGGVEYNRLTVFFSYDVTVSSLITSTGGAYELSIAYTFSRVNAKLKKRMGAIPCPGL